MREKNSNSKSSRKFAAASSPELKKHGIHEPSMYEQDFLVFAKKLGMSAVSATFSMEAYKNKCIDMENVYDSVDASRHSSRAEFSVEFGNLQQHKIRGS